MHISGERELQTCALGHKGRGRGETAGSDDRRADYTQSSKPQLGIWVLFSWVQETISGGQWGFRTSTGRMGTAGWARCGGSHL